MKRAQAQEALDSAFASGVARLFQTLVSNLIAKEKNAAATFHAGIAMHDEAHSIASAELEKIFPE